MNGLEIVNQFILNNKLKLTALVDSFKFLNSDYFNYNLNCEDLNLIIFM